MTPEEEMKNQLFRDFNEAYLDIAKYLSEITIRRNLLLEKGVSPTNREVEILTNLIESTKIELDNWSETIRELRRKS